MKPFKKFSMYEDSETTASGDTMNTKEEQTQGDAKEENLPPDNETVEDGGGCFVAGSQPHIQCAVLKDYWCFETDCVSKGCKLQIKGKIFLDGKAKGDYIQQNIAFRREMEMNYAKNLDELGKLQAFKDYVHKRLDDAGVPIDPDSPHKAAGCRIGGRLDFVLIKERETIKELKEELKKALEYIKQSP